MQYVMRGIENMTKAKPSFYAVIPANVRYDKSLTDGAKLLFGEITALCSDKGYCWATNSYFAGLYGVSNTTISTWVSRLEKAGHIKRVIKYKEGSKEIEGRYLSILNGGMQENLNTPIQENLKESTTSLSTTSINTKDIVEIVTYLNDVADKNYKHSTRKTRTLIKARVSEGFTIDDFKKVIDIKNDEWKNDTKMQKFIRPETLFGTKFESYLNQESPNGPSGYDPNNDAF